MDSEIPTTPRPQDLAFIRIDGRLLRDILGGEIIYARRLIR